MISKRDDPSAGSARGDGNPGPDQPLPGQLDQPVDRLLGRSAPRAMVGEASFRDPCT